MLVRDACGILVLAHPNDPNGTSLLGLTADLKEQTNIIEQDMLDNIDGIECWHSRHNVVTVEHYLRFCWEHGFLMTGGSDCHQNPVLLGTVAVPDFVAKQFIQMA
ncbi:MAG: hypothetical protein A2144_06840 [Chloroflexi bacterium RBG_16_50_9]|nr:MAG: hypothetical protein A2144_06840 [Chloroflexi bacterium RBG_16_50_9]